MRFRCRRTALRRSFISERTTSLIASRAPSTYSRTEPVMSSIGIASMRSSPRSRAARYPRADRSPAQRAPFRPRFAIQRAPGSACFPAQRAPSSPASAAHLAPLPVAASTGEMGRRPPGPTRNIRVMTAPTAAPRRAAVRRSYCCSRSSAEFVSRTDARVRLLPLGVVFNVSSIQVLLRYECFVNSCAHAANRRCSGDERSLCFFLHDCE